MSLPLWTLDEIAAATGARIVGRPSEATGVSIDTRTLAPGDLFFAIKGDVHDGHGFVRDALAKGAAASRRGGARTRRSSPSPARSARPAPRRRCGSPSSG